MRETTAAAPAMTASDYVQQCREELYALEGRVERVELMRDDAIWEMPPLERRHHEAADHAKRMEMLTATIPTEKSIPAPPFNSKATSPKGVGTYEAGPRAFIPRPGAAINRAGRPAWK